MVGLTNQKSFDKFDIENAASTLVRAEEIKANKKLMKVVKPELRNQAKAATKAAGTATRLAGGKKSTSHKSAHRRR